MFLIDRQKHLRSTDQAYDYIICFNRPCGFVARVVRLSADAYKLMTNEFANIDNTESMYISARLAYNEGFIVVTIVDFLYDFEFTEETTKRVHSLLKQALGKYLHEGYDVENSAGAEKQIAYSDYWWCENKLSQEGFEAIIKVSPPQVFVKFSSKLAMGASFKDFYKNIAEVSWFGTEPSEAVKSNILLDAWNYLALEERILDNDIDNMPNDEI